MPHWQAILVFCFALATAMYFRFILPDPDRGGGALPATESRMARLKRFRTEHGACIRCGERLARVDVANSPSSLVCPHCGPASGA